MNSISLDAVQPRYLLSDVAGMDRFNNKWHLNLETWCWEWQASKTPNGYGQISATCPTKARYLAHRLSYLHYKGEIPESMIIDHICHNRSCVNPDHLQVVTAKQNSMFAVTRDKSHFAFREYCKRGHRRTEDNIYIIPSSGSRQCLQCKLDQSRVATMTREQLERRRAYDKERRQKRGR
jgi:hypothetical protein